MTQTTVSQKQKNTFKISKDIIITMQKIRRCDWSNKVELKCSEVTAIP